MNPLHPAKLSADERLNEIAEILSLGLVRLRSAQSSQLSPQSADHRVDSSAAARMCGPGKPLEKTRA
jgi:hypothetical protein